MQGLGLFSDAAKVVLYRGVETICADISQARSGFPNTSIVRTLPRSAKHNRRLFQKKLEGFSPNTGLSHPRLIGRSWIDFLC